MVFDPGAPSFITYKCSKCNYTTTDVTNARKHTTVRRCIGAHVVRQEIHVLAWTEDADVARQIRERGGAVPLGRLDAPPPQVAQVPRVLTRAVLASDAILPAFSDQEDEAMREHVRPRAMLLLGPRGRPPHAGACTRLFKLGKLGARVPPPLRNMGLSGNNVHYKDEDGPAQTSRGCMAKALLPWLLQVMRGVLQDALDDTETGDTQREQALMGLWDALFQPRRGWGVSIEEAAAAYEGDPDKFRACEPGLQACVRREARALAEMLAHLPRFSCRGP